MLSSGNKKRRGSSGGGDNRTYMFMYKHKYYVFIIYMLRI
jgi:hypothetical protein